VIALTILLQKLSHAGAILRQTAPYVQGATGLVGAMEDVLGLMENVSPNIMQVSPNLIKLGLVGAMEDILGLMENVFQRIMQVSRNLMKLGLVGAMEDILGLMENVFQRIMQVSPNLIKGGHKRMVQIAGPHVETRGELVQHFVVLVDTAVERVTEDVQWELQKLLQCVTHALQKGVALEELEVMEALLALEALQSMMGGHKRMVQIAGHHVETRGDLVQDFVVLVDTAVERVSVAVQWELQKLLHGSTHVLQRGVKR